MSKSSKIQDLSNDHWDQQTALTISFDSIRDSPNGASINGSPQLVFALGLPAIRDFRMTFMA